MQFLAIDLRYAVRSLVRRKAYFLTCAATLALVLGANAAMFAVVNATMLRPMPFATHGLVLQLFSQPPGTTAASARNPLQQMEVPRLRERARTLARLEGFLLSERVVTMAGEPTAVQMAAVTPGLLSMMAAPIAQGRSFLPVDGEPGHAVAVISHRYWRDVLGSAPVVDATLVIDGAPHAIVGVLSPAFAVPFMDAQVFTPLVANREAQPRAPPRSVVGIAELAPSASIDQAREELAKISSELAREFPRTHSGWILGAQSVRDWQYGTMRVPLLMLLGATTLVVLIACVNVANLSLANAVSRSGELSLRVALGASRRDVVKLHLAELLVIGISGLIPGLVIASLAVPALLAIDPAVSRTLGVVAVDWRVQVFGASLALLTAILASAAPALRAFRGHTAATLAAGTSRTTATPGAMRARRILVSIEVALCVALLITGGALIQGLRELSRRGPGYDARGVMTAQVRLLENPYKTPELRALAVSRLLEDIRSRPMVESASTVQNPFQPGFSYQTLLNVKARPLPDGQSHTVQFRRVSPDYFRTLRIKGISGREFTEQDTAAQPPIAIISQRFATTLLAGLDPIGQVLVRQNAPELTIVGVVQDVADVNVTEEPQPTVYLPWAQNNNVGVPVTFVVRTSAAPESIVPAVRDAVKQVDSSLPLRRVQRLESFVNESTAPERFRTVVLTIIAMLGLVLAALGIAGVTYRGVVDRSREIAVRMALGSGPEGVIRMVLAESMRDLVIGAVVGLAGGVAFTRLLATSMPHVGAVDAFTVSAAVAVIVGVGALAAFVPALKVRRVEPAEALRS